MIGVVLKTGLKKLKYRPDVGKQDMDTLKAMNTKPFCFAPQICNTLALYINLDFQENTMKILNDEPSYKIVSVVY